MPISTRLARLLEKMGGEELDCLVVTGFANRFYLSGFTGDNGVLVITNHVQHLFTDFRYLEQAARESPSFDVHRCGTKFMQELGQWLADEGGSRIGIESSHLTLAAYQELTRAVPADRLVPGEGRIEKLRATKEPEEIESIREAAAITDRAWARLLPSIKAGAGERDLAAELDYLLRREGADGTAFPTIVASGFRGALPHGIASDKKLSPGELVVCDFGAVYRGYSSDMTRTVAVGEPDEKARRIYETVAQAQTKALSILHPGLSVREVDAAAREHIKKAGYGEFFGHGLGHSVGIEIHEEPRLAPTDDSVLQPGMVVTVEPGIYLPGMGGVRIEDLVVLTETGYMNLTNSSKELLVMD